MTIVLFIVLYLMMSKSIEYAKMHPDAKMNFDMSLGCLFIFTIPVDIMIAVLILKAVSP